MGFYAASKHAIEGYAESLDHEVRGLGIRAILVEPTFTKTRLDRNAAVAAQTIGDYAETRARGERAPQRQRRLQRRPVPGRNGHRRRRSRDERHAASSPGLGKGAGTLAKLRSFLPARLFDRSFRKQFQLENLTDRSWPCADPERSSRDARQHRRGRGSVVPRPRNRRQGRSVADVMSARWGSRSAAFTVTSTARRRWWPRPSTLPRARPTDRHVAKSAAREGGAEVELLSLLDRYLSHGHRQHPGQGCPVAALCSEVGHGSKETKKAFTVAIERLLTTVDDGDGTRSRG